MATIPTAVTSQKHLGGLDEPGLKEVRPGVWALRVYAGRRPNGSPVQRRRLVDSGTGRVNAGIREARTELAKMRAEVQEDGGSRRTMPPTGLTVAKLLDRYITHCETQDRSPTTIREYRRIVAKILVPRLGSLQLDDLDQDHLDRMYADLAATGRKGNTIRHVHSLMSASLTHGQKKKLLKQNVASLASPPPAIDAEVEPPTPDQVSAMIHKAEATNRSFAALLVIAALTGARRGEICALRWCDISGNTLTIAQSAYETDDRSIAVKEPKTRQKRRLGLDPVALKALRSQRAAMDDLAASLGLEVPDNGYVFSESPQGIEPLRPGLVSERYARVAKAVGASSTRFHALRHFHGTRAIANGHDVVTVSKRLGHSDPSMTLRIYAHAIEQRDRDLAAAMGAELDLSKSALTVKQDP